VLSEAEKERYARQLLIPGWDQEKLAGATVLIVGLGGLGSASALYLAAAGVGRIRICDGDKVERPDLNRQVLYSERSLGLAKVEEAARRLTELNPGVTVETRGVPLDARNAPELVKGCQLIVDGLDNIKSRFLLSAEAFKQRIPLVYGAVQGWQGYAGLFDPPRTACLACLMGSDILNRNLIQVPGVTPGAIGLIQANEAIKLLLGMTPSLFGRLLIYDGRELSFEIISLDRNPACPVCSRV
jgi:molybdopterin/thiamine biosynthesis adenylyltransferase